VIAISISSQSSSSSSPLHFPLFTYLHHHHRFTLLSSPVLLTSSSSRSSLARNLHYYHHRFTFLIVLSHDQFTPHAFRQPPSHSHLPPLLPSLIHLSFILPQQTSLLRPSSTNSSPSSFLDTRQREAHTHTLSPPPHNERVQRPKPNERISHPVASTTSTRDTASLYHVVSYNARNRPDSFSL